jgi:RimJ/RimL family protein N-acetyltransferase
MIFREAKKHDWPILLEWRNDAESRMASKNTEIVREEDHKKWLDDILRSDNHKLIIAEIDDEPAGIVRLNYTNNWCELSWTISPNKRGEGFGKEIVKTVSDSIDDPILVTIRKDNIPSIKIAEYVGLHFYKQEGDMLFYTNSNR